MASGSGWNLCVCLAGGGCGWNLWVWLVGVVVRTYIDFLIINYYLSLYTPLVSALFCSSIPTFEMYVINNFSRSINTHTGDYGHPMEAV